MPIKPIIFLSDLDRKYVILMHPIYIYINKLNTIGPDCEKKAGNILGRCIYMKNISCHILYVSCYQSQFVRTLTLFAFAIVWKSCTHLLINIQDYSSATVKIPELFSCDL